MEAALLEDSNGIVALLVAALLGFLIGLERERKREAHGSIFAGVRTFPLIALFGAVAGQLSQMFGSGVVMAALLALAILLALSYWRSSEGPKVGGTTEMAALVAFGLGVFSGLDRYALALAGAVIVTAVLSLRQELRDLTQALTREDLFAMVQFAVISLVVLPLVPDEQLGPWGVWNPRAIWWQVVLISGISFVGYAATKVIGTKRGIALSGLVGGLASSTAVTLSFSEHSKKNSALSLMLAAGVLASSTIMVPRMIILLGIVQPELIPLVITPLLALLVTTVIGWGLIYRASTSAAVESAKINNPFEIRSALQFALIFAAILLVTRAAKEFLGDSGVYAASFIAGLTQINGITLALGDQVDNGLNLAVAAKGLALAAASNTLFKVALALSLGSKQFGQALVVTLLLSAAACVATAWFVPTARLF